MLKNKNLAFTQLEKYISNIFVIKVNIAGKKLLNFKKKNLGVFLEGFTRLEKLINNILKIKVGKISKKLLNIRRNNLSVSLTGFTLIEMMIVFAIIGIMSVFYVVNTRPRPEELLKMDTTRLAADIRYVRSMATTRATYNGSFPGGYGIIFQNGTGPTIPPAVPKKSSYILFAGSYIYPLNPSNIIKTVELSDIAFRLVDPNGSPNRADVIGYTDPKSFSFKSENDVTASTNFGVSVDGDYQIEVYYDKGVNPVYYDKSTINIGRKTEDNFVWSNLAITYETRGVVCGNGIEEAGEDCERFDDNGVLLRADCFPAGLIIDPDDDSSTNNSVNMGCKSNSCGDGLVAGAEQCERNILATFRAVTVYSNLCDAPHNDWCYLCSQLEIAPGKCKNMDGDTISCCMANANKTLGYCLDCQWANYPTCPVDITEEDECPIAPE